MVKNVRFKAGSQTALVISGWILFGAGLLCSNPLVSIPLLAGARVLP